MIIINETLRNEIKSSNAIPLQLNVTFHYEYGSLYCQSGAAVSKFHGDVAACSVSSVQVRNAVVVCSDVSVLSADAEHKFASDHRLVSTEIVRFVKFQSQHDIYCGVNLEI